MPRVDYFWTVTVVMDSRRGPVRSTKNSLDLYNGKCGSAHGISPALCHLRRPATPPVDDDSRRALLSIVRPIPAPPDCDSSVDQARTALVSLAEPRQTPESRLVPQLPTQHKRISPENSPTQVISCR